MANRRPDHVGVGMARARRIARIGQATGKARGETKTLLNFSQHQHATIRRQPSTVGPGVGFLVFDT